MQAMADVCFNPSSAGLIYIWETNFVTTVPADGLAPNGARLSAGIVLMIKLDILSSKFLWIPVVYHFIVNILIFLVA